MGKGSFFFIIIEKIVLSQVNIIRIMRFSKIDYGFKPLLGPTLKGSFTLHEIQTHAMAIQNKIAADKYMDSHQRKNDECERIGTQLKI